MAEMIVPGTYIDVRAEGLISAGRIATGIVGIVGTAANGPIREPITLSGFSSAREIFGSPDEFLQPEDGAHPLILVRALQFIYANGASTVIAVRVASSSAASATLLLQSETGEPVVRLSAKTPGTWANDMQALVQDATDDCRIQGETLTTGFNRLRYAPIVESPDNQICVLRRVTRVSRIIKVVTTRIVKAEPVTPNGSGRFILANTPVVAVPAVNVVRVLDRATGNVVRTYLDPNILYGAGGPPAVAEIRIANDTGEITFEASQQPTAAQRIEASYAVGHVPPQPGEVLITVWDGTLTFAAGEAPVQANGDRLTANYYRSVK